MLHIPNTLIVVIALNAASMGWAGDGSGGKGDASSRAPTMAWPKLQWKKGTASPFKRVESPTVVVDGKLYVFGGFVTGLGASNEVDVYDPANDSWTRLKDMPTRVTHLDPAVDRGTLWLAGGFKGKHPGLVTNE